jgi:hypothetical protein
MTDQPRIGVWLKRGGLFACCLLLALAIGVVVLAVLSGGSTSGTLAGGRAVTTFSDSWYIDALYKKDTATIDTAGFRIVVTPDRLDVDGQRIASISAAVKSVNVRVKGGEITFQADGKWVATYQR